MMVHNSGFLFSSVHWSLKGHIRSWPQLVMCSANCLFCACCSNALVTPSRKSTPPMSPVRQLNGTWLSCGSYGCTWLLQGLCPAFCTKITLCGSYGTYLHEGVNEGFACKLLSKYQCNIYAIHKISFVKFHSLILTFFFFWGGGGAGLSLSK